MNGRTVIVVVMVAILAVLAIFLVIGWVEGDGSQDPNGGTAPQLRIVSGPIPRLGSV